MGGYAKTFILMAAMTALFMGVGGLLGGMTGALIALCVAAAMNVFGYWNADKAVLSMQNAKPVDLNSAPEFVGMVYRLADNAALPRPKVYIIETDQPNAFATGRNPQNAAVAATTGLLRRLAPDEIAAVMAHELAHVQHRDTLIMTLTATFAGAISMLANFALFFGGNRDRQGGLLGTLALMILAPLAAALVQMAISRSREYEADRRGALICGQPMALARALQKIENFAKGIANPIAERNPALAHMFIINPLHGGRGRDALFSTHPSTQNRIDALSKIARTQEERHGEKGGGFETGAPSARMNYSSLPKTVRSKAAPPKTTPLKTPSVKTPIPSAGKRDLPSQAASSSAKGPWYK